MFQFTLPLERGNGTKFEHGEFRNTFEEEALAKFWNNQYKFSFTETEKLGKPF